MIGRLGHVVQTHLIPRGDLTLRSLSSIRRIFCAHLRLLFLKKRTVRRSRTPGKRHLTTTEKRKHRSASKVRLFARSASRRLRRLTSRHSACAPRNTCATSRRSFTDVENNKDGETTSSPTSVPSPGGKISILFWPAAAVQFTRRKSDCLGTIVTPGPEFVKCGPPLSSHSTHPCGVLWHECSPGREKE